MTNNSTSKSRSFRADRWCWFIFLLAVFGGSPLAYAWYHRRILPPAPQAHRQETPFKLAVLEYTRLSADKRLEALTGKELEAQLRLLLSKGYVPVRPSQVIQAYTQGITLPPKALLVTFDGGYLTSYEEAHPVLARLRCPALMFLDTGRQERRDPNFLYWDRLQIMIDSGIWEIGTHGHRPLAPNGTPLGQLGSGEAAFAASQRLVESNLRHARVTTFAHLANLAPDLSLGGAKDPKPNLAFRTDLFGVNSPEDSPIHLNRLRVDPAWSPERLLERLNSAMEDASAAKPERVVATSWISDRRDKDLAPRFTPAGFVLKGARRSGAWLAGSRWAEDWAFQAQFQIDHGEFWVAQEADFGGRHWRFGGKQGLLYFQDRTPGLAPVTLARIPFPNLVGAKHDLRITRRGPGLWIELDGHPVSDRPFLLPFRALGSIGIISGPDGSAPANLTVDRIRFEGLRYDSFIVSPNPSSIEIQTLEQQVPRIAALCPTWIDCKGGQQKEAALNQDLLRLLQRRLALDVLPVILIQDASAPQDASWILPFAKRAQDMGWNGLKLNFKALPPAQQEAWQKVALGIGRQVNTHGFRIYSESLNMNEGVLR